MTQDKPFPECAKGCRIVAYLGVGECEDVCPNKFDKGDKPMTQYIADVTRTSVEINQILNVVAILHGIQKNCVADGDSFYFISDCGGDFKTDECRDGDMGRCADYDVCFKLDKACKLLTEIQKRVR